MSVLTEPTNIEQLDLPNRMPPRNKFSKAYQPLLLEVTIRFLTLSLAALWNGGQQHPHASGANKQ